MTSTELEHRSWTAIGADDSAQRTYVSVKQALAEIMSRRNVEVFLQGSYANSTNIRADSDVDIVVMTRRTFQGSVERLGPSSRRAFEAMPAASFTADDLRSEVFQALVSYYGLQRVHQKNKCIRVDKQSGYVDADVVPCLQYRWYPKPDSDPSSGFIEGISINPLRGNRIINFPKEHIRHGKDKNKRCLQHYKKTVRQIKRLRNRAVQERILRREVAPGYLLECMTFNVPDSRFIANDSSRLKDVLLWLKFADKLDFDSCDRIHKLFKDDPGDFSVDIAQEIADALWVAY